MYFQVYQKFTIKICEKQILSRYIRKYNSSFYRCIHKQQTMDSSFANTACVKNISSTNKLIRYNNILKSQQDNREYRGLQLSNGLKVLLASDPTTDKSAAALSVDVGHLSDPENLPGLAHFCEHMLFLGTQKYPNENDYNTYLSENGGNSNAVTFADSTKYYFEVMPDKLEGALDRFSQFFIAPLFTESATEKEINAVNSEHEKNLAIDNWRVRQVNKSLANPKHPYSKFGSGNKKTLCDDPKLNGINVRDELIKFHSKWYSANIMYLSVFGKESLDELENMVLSKFSDVVNKDIEAPRWSDQPYQEDQYATKVCIVPIKDTRSLIVSFSTPDLDMYYKSGPDNYLSHLMGHEGKGTILSDLKAKGWCNNLNAGQATTARGFGSFEVIVDLTQDGFENVDQIVKIIFQYINLLKREKPQKRIFEEFCNINEMQFRFKDKETPLSLVSAVVHSMQLYPLEEVLSAPYLVTEWRPDLITKLLNALTPEKVRIVVIGQKLEPKCTENEYWYGTKFYTEKISKSTLDDWNNCGFNENFFLPRENPFIPTDFNLLAIEKDVTEFPNIIYDTPYMRVWFKQDTEFLKPKTIMNIDFSSPIVYIDPLNCNLTYLFVQLFQDQLDEYLYEAELAGLRFTVANTTYGISLNISGYSHKQQILLQKVLDQMFNFEVNPQRFEILKEQYIRGLKNFQAEQPFQQAVYYLALILTENAWTKKELIDATELVTIKRLESFIKEFLSRLHAECFICGNVTRQKSLELTCLVEQKLKNTNAITLPLLARQLLLKREYKLCDGENYLFETENDFHKSSCAELYLQCGVQNDKSNVFIDLASKILSEPCFNTLRTKEQLGYIVYCGSRKVNGCQGIRIIVQASKCPSYVEERIELFLDGMTSQLEAMPDDEFNRYKESLALQKLEKPKRLSVLFNRFLSEISHQQYHFDRANVEVAILRTITKQQFIDYYKQFIIRSSPSRHALSIHVVSTLENTESTNEEKKIEQENADTIIKVPQHTTRITDLSTFKSSKELYAMVQPYINIKPKGGRSKL